MKATVEEINDIHKSLGEIRDKMNELYRVFGTGNLAGRSIRDAIYRERLDLFIKDADRLKERLKELVNE